YPGDGGMVVEGVSDRELLEIYHLQAREIAGQRRLPFYFGDAEALTADFMPPKMDFTFRYTNAPKGIEPVRKYKLELESPPKDFPSAKGIIILLHSYSTNAQSVFFDSVALQLQGYHTASFDLLGHGQAGQQPVSFGAADLKRLHRLITTLKQQYQLPVILYGKSYGASIAAQYIASCGSISGFIAVAPMTDFTPAATRVAKSSSPLLTKLVSDQWLQTTLENVLTERQTNSRQLSTPRILLRQTTDSLPPTLILAGGLDKISDPEQIKALATIDAVKVKYFDNRGHIEMMIFDNQLNDSIKPWLNNL
ncbi:MAG TPA: alpha/beta hydrolase, partial [Idiomarina sp.]|nr:alpha/beta hydrolase [Idiomarina sp.]